MPDLILQLQHFFLVVMRVGCVLFFMPIWDSRTVPAQVKIFSILVIALVLTPVVGGTLPPFPHTWVALLFLVLRELLLGLSLGLVVRFVFSGIQMAGTLLGVQMGFGMVTLIDPQTADSSSLIADVFTLTATVLFLALDGHHMLLRVLAQSFGEAPVGGPALMPAGIFSFLLPMGSVMFQLMVKLVAPILLVLFLTQVAMGLVARTVPRVQVMIMAFPLTIALGLVFLSLTMTLIGYQLSNKFSWLQAPLAQVLKLWHG
ncbi:MAG: flagellar biosynthetic protein FliR [Thermodesulfobacteriota bacterium]